jgi:hypothetical protein
MNQTLNKTESCIFIEGSDYTGFWFIQGSVYTGFWFIEGSVYTGFWILFYLE